MSPVYVNWAISTILLVLMFICGFAAGVTYLTAILGWRPPRPRCSSVRTFATIAERDDLGVKNPITIRCIHKDHPESSGHLGVYRSGLFSYKRFIGWNDV